MKDISKTNSAATSTPIITPVELLLLLLLSLTDISLVTIGLTVLLKEVMITLDERSLLDRIIIVLDEGLLLMIAVDEGSLIDPIMIAVDEGSLLDPVDPTIVTTIVVGEGFDSIKVVVGVLLVSPTLLVVDITTAL